MSGLSKDERKSWEEAGFVPGAVVFPTGPSWNQSRTAQTLLGMEGTIVASLRKRPKGVCVKFTRTNCQWDSEFVYHPKNLKLKRHAPGVQQKIIQKKKPTKDSLRASIRAHIRAHDAATLEERVDAAVEALNNKINGGK